MKKEKRDITEIFYNGIVLLFLLVFIPVLFCVFWFGTNMDYFWAIKIETLCSNRVLFVLILVFLAMLFGFFYLCRKIKMTKIISRVLDIGLFLASVILYFVNLEIAKCIYMRQGWDVDSVVGAALELHKGNPMGNLSYFSVYPNNVPISYFLARQYDMYDKIGNLNFDGHFFWVCVNCIVISVTGFLGSMIVKKITNSVPAVLFAFFLHVACVGITPWKTTAYTDMGALLFPVLSVFFYVYYYNAQKGILRYILWFLFLLSGFWGALIKPTVLVVVIAGILMELIRCSREFKTEWKKLVVKIALVGVTILLHQAYKGYIYEQCDYVYNDAAAVTYHHYLLMGMNEYSTGGYDSDVMVFHGQFTDSEVRKAAQWEKIFTDLKERGFVGHLHFLLKKMVMTFNDGAFGWGREGQYYYYYYPTYSYAPYAEFLRDVFWPNFKYWGRFNTYSQLIWLLVILGMPGIVLRKKDEDRHLKSAILLTILGVIGYLMLFESRARYLLCFSPILIVASAIGIWEYYNVLVKVIKKRKMRIKERSDE